MKSKAFYLNEHSKELLNHQLVMTQDPENWFEQFGIAPDNFQDLTSLAEMFEGEGNTKEAIKVYQHIIKYELSSDGAKHALELIRSKSIPNWHFDMLSDTRRNDAFEKAISKVATEKSRALDIGTGSGLLAMMAARAGAASVLACEENSDLANVAERIVEANGYSDNIRVVNKRSDQLEEGDDFEQKFDLIVSEILDSGGLGEGILSSLRQAKREMGTPDVKIIPAGISLKAQLIEFPERYLVNPIKDISGFDLSIFNEFRVSDTYVPVDLKHEDYLPLSEVFNLRAYDFYNIHAQEIDFDNPEVDLHEVEISEVGQVQAVAFWFDLHMDEDESYSTGPGGELDHWLQAVYFFEQPKDVSKGDQVAIKALYSDWMVRFRLP